MKKIKSIKTQSDFDRQMSSLSDELRNIITPLLQEEDRIKITISEDYFRKSEILVALEQNRTLWAEIQDKKNIREEKLACLAEGRRLKLELAKIGGVFLSQKCSSGVFSRNADSRRSLITTRCMNSL